MASCLFSLPPFIGFYLLVFLGDTFIVTHDCSVYIFLNLCSIQWEKGPSKDYPLPQCPSASTVFGCLGFLSAAPLIDFSCSYNNPMEWFPKISNRHFFHLKFSNPQKCCPTHSMCSIPAVMMQLMVEKKPHRNIQLSGL